MNRDAIARFPVVPYGLVHAVYYAAYNIVAPSLEPPERGYFLAALQAIPASFYIRWMRSAAAPDFEDLCEDFDLAPAMRSFLSDARFYYLVTPESLADFTQYCQETICEAERASKRKNTKSKTPYDVLHDIEPYTAHIRNTVINPGMAAGASSIVRAWMRDHQTIEIWIATADYLLRFTYMRKAGVDTGLPSASASVATSVAGSPHVSDTEDEGEADIWLAEEDL